MSKVLTTLSKRLTKLILNIFILAGFVVLIWYGYRLFTSQVSTPLTGAILLIVGGIVWICVIWFLRKRYRWTKPSFKLTTFAVIIIALIFMFAGVHPLASYKDGVVSKWNTYQAEQQLIREEQRAQAERDEALAKEEAERQAEEEQQERDIREEENKAKEEQAKEEREKAQQMEIIELEHDVVMLVNLIRADRGTSMLMWDETLYQYSKAHSIAMAERRELFHSPVGLAYAENAWGGEGSQHWGVEDIVDSWYSSPMHKTWLLCPNLKHVAVGVAYSENGMYASWTFWVNETSDTDWWYQYTPDNPPDWWY